MVKEIGLSHSYFSEKNAKIKKENEELELEEQIKLNNCSVNKTIQSDIPLNNTDQPIDIELEEIEPELAPEIANSQSNAVINPHINKEVSNPDSNTTIITKEETKETQLIGISIDPEEIVDKIPEEVILEDEINLEEELELKIIDALETILKEDLYELEELEYEFKLLNEKQETEVDYEEIEKLKEELQELLKKFELIKEKYDIYQNSDKENYIDLDDEFIYDLILEYKKETQENTLIQQINDQVEKIEEYIGVIEKIIEIETDTDELDKELDEKLEKFEIRDEEFEKLKMEYENIEDINKLIDTFNRKQEEIMKDLDSKVNAAEDITRRVETTTSYITNFNRLIQMALLISVSKRIPPTPTGIILKTNLMLGAINAAAHFITTRENTREIVRVNYPNYENEIKNAAESTTTAITQIDDAFISIDAIREKFKNECEEYKDQIEEYDKLLKNLDNVERELKEKQKIAKKYNKKFNKILHINKEKVKRKEELETAA